MEVGTNSFPFFIREIQGELLFPFLALSTGLPVVLGKEKGVNCGDYVLLQCGSGIKRQMGSGTCPECIRMMKEMSKLNVCSKGEGMIKHLGFEPLIRYERTPVEEVFCTYLLMSPVCN